MPIVIILCHPFISGDILQRRIRLDIHVLDDYEKIQKSLATAIAHGIRLNLPDSFVLYAWEHNQADDVRLRSQNYV